MPTFVTVLALVLVACHSSSPAVAPTPVITNQAPPPPPPQKLDLDSIDILARTETSSPVLVKHVLVGWAMAVEEAGPTPDPRAQKRSQADAAKLAEEIAAQLRAKPSRIDALVKEHGEDPGALSGDPYEIKTDSSFIPEFKNLALRLRLDEVGLVKTRYGYHVMIRVAPPPPDPIESADILARPAGTNPVEVQHILVGWAGLATTRDPRAKARTKADADALATEVLAKVRAGGDMAALMKQYSEDPASADSGKTYPVEPDSPYVEPFRNLSLRLNVGEAGLVKTAFGWHIVKRVPPPPPDPLESAAILARAPVTEKAEVKHILLGWTEAHAADPRGEQRTRAQLEKLLAATLKRVARKGAKFEAVMAELSEDPGSAKSGVAYTATPGSGLVKPFLQMSLRLEVGEVGVVRTDFGMHIIKRVE